MKMNVLMKKGKKFEKATPQKQQSAQTLQYFSNYETTKPYPVLYSPQSFSSHFHGQVLLRYIKILYPY